MKKLSFIVTLMLFTSVVNAQNLTGNSYRGFVDAGYSIGIGYQFNPYFFLGAGMGFHFMSSYETDGMEIALDKRDSQVDIPIFANVRCNFSKKKVAPFIDLKGGTFVTNNGGLYANASIGCRVSLNEKQAISIAVGYASEKLEFETFDSFIGHTSMDYTRSATKYTTESISIKLGFEF